MNILNRGMAFAVVNNDLKAIEKCFEIFRLPKKDNGIYPVTHSAHICFETMLGTAAAVSERQNLAEETKKVLLNQFSKVVNIFVLAETICISERILREDSIAPKQLLAAIQADKFDDKVKKTIKSLKPEELKKVLAFIAFSESLITIDPIYAPALISRIHELKIIPDSTLFALMAVSLERPVDIVTHEDLGFISFFQENFTDN